MSREIKANKSQSFHGPGCNWSKYENNRQDLLADR
jgi:hypothetical protein